MGLIKVLYDFLRPIYVIDPKNAVSMERYPLQIRLSDNASKAKIFQKPYIMIC